MRFFTEHFFSEEQKTELLGDKYAQAQRRVSQTEREAQSRAIEIAQIRERLKRQEDEFERQSRIVELTVLPIVLSATIVLGLAVSFLLDGYA